jgi:tetratricopeptide (TPR) repeat protein
MANWVSDRGDQVKALQLQPYSSEYLSRISIDALNQKQYTLAFNCAEKALFYYDGENPEWAMLHNFGQVALVNGAWSVAKSSFEQALLIYPTSKVVLKSLKDINGALRKLEVEERKAALTVNS